MMGIGGFSLILLFDLLTSVIITNNANTMSEKTELLLKNLDEIKSYFPHENEQSWADKYKNANFDHDEPWVTLMGIYSILGNWQEPQLNKLQALQHVFNQSGCLKPPAFTKLTSVLVEKKLPEIIKYRDYLKIIFQKDNFHLYPNIRQIIERCKKDNNDSLEGNTNLDLFFEGECDGTKTTCFIEAKFLSDISYQIKYNPVRDQIIRNIDCGIDYVLNKENELSFENFYFFLLTPKVFRPRCFGPQKTSEISKFGADTSRLYCYKMLEYQNPAELQRRLPHRELTSGQWEAIAANIGWITFEDMYNCANHFGTMGEHRDLIHNFFEERNLL